MRRLVSAVAAATATTLLLAACDGAAAGNQATAKDASITVAAGDITTENFNPFSSTALQPT
ncbi:MAG: ABC transporter substrate-binding protein, partial [Kribbellaceae bacterium]|nr:ABC transporter substrate-binding protein [Kribbellaceae bacterium]